MSVQVEEFPTSLLSRARSPMDYSSLEEEEPDSCTDTEVFSFSVEGIDSPYNSSDDDAIIAMDSSHNSRTDVIIAPKQKISFISQITLVFDYPQIATLPTAQSKPQSVAKLNRDMVPIPGVEISFRSEIEIYCDEATVDQDIRREKLLQSPGDTGGKKLTNTIKIRQNKRR